MKNDRERALLVILDGFGYSAERHGNAIALAKTPVLDGLWRNYPHTLLSAAGEHVGLPWGVTGNSEAGHLNLGAGRVVFQAFPAIQRAIADETFYRNKVILEGLRYARTHHSAVHLVGLLSRGGVHAHLDLIQALLEVCKRTRTETVFLHLFTDGRDAEPKSALEFLGEAQSFIEQAGRGIVASLVGRAYAMDRNHHWKEATRLAFELLVHGKGEAVRDPRAALQAAYRRGLTDEFVPPMVIVNEDGAPVGTIKENDVVVAFNFREDRIRQLVSAFSDRYFPHFSRGAIPQGLRLITFAPLRQLGEFALAFPHSPLKNTLSEVIAREGLRQYRIAETEKYAHVTYFLGGRHEEPFRKEKRFLIHSPAPQTFIRRPAMRAPEIAEKARDCLQAGTYDFGAVNFANADMLGHTGNLKAAIKAVELLDKLLGEILVVAHLHDVGVFITADHGNAEQMINPQTKAIDSEHTINPVPLIAAVAPWQEHAGKKPAPKLAGVLADVGPTMLDYMGIKKPAEMTGYSLLELLHGNVA